MLHWCYFFNLIYLVNMLLHYLMSSFTACINLAVFMLFCMVFNTISIPSGITGYWLCATCKKSFQFHLESQQVLTYFLENQYITHHTLLSHTARALCLVYKNLT